MVGCVEGDYSRGRARSRLIERRSGDAMGRTTVSEAAAVVGATEEQRSSSMAGSIGLEAKELSVCLCVLVSSPGLDKTRWSRQFGSGGRRNTQIRYSEPSMLKGEKP